MQAPAFPLRRPLLAAHPMRVHRARSLKPKLRLLAALAAVVGLGVVGWLTLRDSSLVAVRSVEVSGVSGAQREAIVTALETAGRDMTTLHVRPKVLESAVAPYAVVERLRIETDKPHGLRVRVYEHVAVATVVTPQGSVPVAADGTVLAGSTATGVPQLKLKLPPAGKRITEPHTLAVIDLLGAAPAPLRPRIATAFRGPRGLTIHLTRGPAAYFGSGERMTAKWASLTAVLASSASRGATAIDVRVPEHPAAAGLEQASTQRGQPSTGG